MSLSIKRIKTLRTYLVAQLTLIRVFKPLTRKVVLPVASFWLFIYPVQAVENKNIDRPNILWVLADDMSPTLGVYGDQYAETPTLDQLASQSTIYTNAFANAPVCAPARLTLMTGVHATSLGGQHMASFYRLPDRVKFVSEELQKAGYYTANIGKYDFNIIPETSPWDQLDTNLMATGWDSTDYLSRTDGKKPFFTVVNLFHTHESQVFWQQTEMSRTGTSGKNDPSLFEPRDRSLLRHDPALAPVPPYHPDVKAVRVDRALTYDNVTVMDGLVANILKKLRSDGLAENTIVFFFADHGTGLPRAKRWPYDSGLRVPLLIHFPKKYAHLAPTKPGERTDRIVSFVDFASTLMSLAGVDAPKHIQGRAFLGTQQSASNGHMYGFRDRMDSRFDLVRSVTGPRFQYIRNYMPHLIYAQHIQFMYRVSTMQVWQQHYDDGLLSKTQQTFFQPKPMEELYDLQADPSQVSNLASQVQYQEKLQRMRQLNRTHILQSRDLGFIPEAELQRQHPDMKFYNHGQDESNYSLEKILAIAELVGERNVKNLPKFKASLKDKDPVIRYWAAVGILALGDASALVIPELEIMLADSAPNPRIVAAQTLCQLGHCERALAVLLKDLEDPQINVRMYAADALDNLNTGALPVIAELEQALKTYQGKVFFARDTVVADFNELEEYRKRAFAPSIKNVLEKTLQDLRSHLDE